MRNIFKLIQLIPGYRGRFARVLIANVLLGLLAVGTPYLFKVIVDSIVALAGGQADTAQAKTSILMALVILGGIRLLTVVSGYFQERASDLLYFETMWGLRKKLFAHLTEISIDYYERNRSGEIVQRVTNATMQLRSLLSQWAEGSLLSVLTLIFIIGILLVKLPAVGVLMLIMVPVMLGSAMYRIRQTQPLQKEWLKLAEKTVGTMNETISLIATIRSFGQERAKIRQFDGETAEFAGVRLRHFKIEWRLGLVQSAVVAVTSVAALAIVAIGALDGRYTAGDILLVLTYVQTVVTSVNPIVRLIINTGEVEVSAERAVELLNVKPTVLDLPDAKPVTTLESIEFRDVTFSYPDKSQKVLDGVSFKLEAGKTLALVGPSGVGKTTITKLLLRFYEPTSGQILINGADIRSYTQDSVRQLVGMVMQDVALFNATVQENLQFARAEASHDDIVAAAQAAHAHDFIEKLANGYDTLVGERGVKLSGGEKQRVAIARAILRDPQLAILDEATSALDSESERYVQKGLQKLMKGRTAIIIAHRLSTVRRADQIVVLKDGTVIERGTHAELADKDGGLYAYLFQLQTEGVLGA